MSSHKVRPEALAMLTETDCKVLLSVYKHRCLNEEQMTEYYYNGQDEAYILNRIRTMIDAGFLEVYEYGEEQKCVFFLTNMGVQFARDSGEGQNYTYSERRQKRSYEATAGTLRMPDRMLDHQTQLNTLSLEIERRCGLDPHCYKDSMFASNFTYAQPDGVFELPEFDIFLEMDMGQERAAALRAKWEHYRTYFNSRDYYLRRNKKIIVLFATQNVTTVSIRRTTVLKSLNQTIFEMFGPMFDCYIGTNEELANIVEQLISGGKGWFQRVGSYLQNKQKFSFGYPKTITEACGERFLYMKREGADGQPQEFLLEDYTSRQVAALRRAAFYKQTQSLLSGKIGQTIPLLLVAPDERAMFQDLLAIDALAVPGVYYTTVDRLRGRKTFYEALFQFDLLGKQYRFTDWSLVNRQYEKKHKLRKEAGGG